MELLTDSFQSVPESLVNVFLKNEKNLCSPWNRTVSQPLSIKKKKKKELSLKIGEIAILNVNFKDISDLRC